jgi:hypothetical protein
LYIVKIVNRALSIILKFDLCTIIGYNNKIMTEKIAPASSGDKKTIKRGLGSSGKNIPSSIAIEDYLPGRDTPLDKSDFLKSPPKISELNAFFETNHELIIEDSPWLSEVRYSGYQALILRNEKNLILAIRSGQTPDQVLSFADYPRPSENITLKRTIVMSGDMQEDIIDTLKFDTEGPVILCSDGPTLQTKLVEKEKFLDMIRRSKVDEKETTLLKHRPPEPYVPKSYIGKIN